MGRGGAGWGGRVDFVGAKWIESVDMQRGDGVTLKRRVLTDFRQVSVKNTYKHERSDF